MSSVPPPEPKASTAVRRRIWFRRGVIALSISLVLGGALFLWIARTQARAMFRFVEYEGAERTTRPEHLSLFEKAEVIVGGVTVPRPQNVSDPKSTHGLDFETHQLANGRGDTLEYWKIPSESPDTTTPLVLLFHGYAASKESLLPCAMEFRQLGCECWLVDFFGSGGSSGNHTSFGWFEAHDVDAVARRAWMTKADDKSGRPIVLYGMSMGGSAIMRALAELETPADGAIVESVFHNLRGTIAQRFYLMNLPAFPAADALLWFGGRDLGFDASLHNPIDYARHIATPVLLLHGGHDTRAPVDKAQEIQRALGGPASIVEFDAAHQVLAGHSSHRWRQAADTFFQNLSTGTPAAAAAAQ